MPVPRLIRDGVRRVAERSPRFVQSAQHLAALEDARDALIDSAHLAVVVSVEAEIHVPTAAIDDYRVKAQSR